MERLPDDVLLTVMQYLDVPALLACRIVCKRLGELALDPSVWRHRKLDDGEDWVCPVLSLAPCVRQLDLGGPLEGGCTSFAMTRCAAKELLLYVERGEATLAALVIRNQEALGRLRCVELDLNDLTGPESSTLLGVLSTVCGLEKLDISIIPTITSSTAKPISHSVVSVPTLTHFTCPLGLELEPFVNFMLAGHAATLEVVTIEEFTDDPDPPTPASRSTSTARVLASASKLSTLKCYALPGMEAVAACKSLLTLHLDIYPDEVALAAAAEFLRRAKQLRNVTLRIGSSSVTYEIANLVTALAASGGQSCLKSLVIENKKWDYCSVVRELVGALPSLPALRDVSLRTTTAELEELLQGITPYVAPALRSLKLRYASGRWMKCAHAWVHTEAVTRLLLLNPLLELIVCVTPYCPAAFPCEHCAMGCHQGLRGGVRHASYTPWMSIPRDQTVLLDRSREAPK